MQRRDFLQTLAALGGSWALGARAAPFAASGAPDGWAAAFAERRARQPWTMGYAGLQQDVAPVDLTLRGRIPAGFAGSFYRNGPARHELGGHRYHHLFDGDGMVQKYTVGERGITHFGRFVRTDKFLADTAAGRPVRAAFGTRLPGMEQVTGPDPMNVANTSVVHHGGELMALWEGGSATRLDAETLDTRGLKTWSPDYAGMPFSAHPRVEPDGTLWNFGVTSLRGLLSVYRVARSGELLDAVTLPVPDIAMVHDFAVTERHLVLLLPPLVFDRERAEAGQSFLDSHVWKPALGLRALVLPKDRLDAPRWFELPAGFVFHLGNACEERDTIRLDCMRTADAQQATHGLRVLMRGEDERHGYAQMALVRLDLRNGRATQDLLPTFAEFPRIDPRVTGRAYRHVYATARLDAVDRPGFDAVMRVDVTTGRHDVYRYGADTMVEEHVFVPRRGGSGREGDGWLVGTALDLARERMLFSVFDAARLADGPIVQGAMLRVMPLGFHAVFVPRA